MMIAMNYSRGTVAIKKQGCYLEKEMENKSTRSTNNVESSRI